MKNTGLWRPNDLALAEPVLWAEYRQLTLWQRHIQSERQSNFWKNEKKYVLLLLDMPDRLEMDLIICRGIKSYKSRLIFHSNNDLEERCAESGIWGAEIMWQNSTTMNILLRRVSCAPPGKKQNTDKNQWSDSPDADCRHARKWI